MLGLNCSLLREYLKWPNLRTNNVLCLNMFVCVTVNEWVHIMYNYLQFCSTCILKATRNEDRSPRSPPSADLPAGLVVGPLGHHLGSSAVRNSKNFSIDAILQVQQQQQQQQRQFQQQQQIRQQTVASNTDDARSSTTAQGRLLTITHRIMN